jgi:glycosyltransferase involved in cell wall biosynthesis
MTRDKRTNIVEKSGIHLVILGPLNFPRGSAPTARTHAYSKCIVENNGKVTIICLKANLRKASEMTNLESEGIIDGIKYIYSPGTTIRSDSFWGRRFLELKGLLNALKIIRRLNRLDKISAILFYSTTTLNEILFTFYARFLNIPVIIEKSEYPFVDRSTLCKKTIAYLHEKYINKLFDGIIVITKYLEKYYKPLIRKDAKSILVPILTDISRFEGHIFSHSNDEYIAYCGDPRGNKDGVPILIEAFSILSKKYETIKLYIIGDALGTNVLQDLKNLAKKSNIENRVVFTGTVTRDKIPEYLCNASILALARPTSLQAKGGFPTKLGEYLATGNPVVVTKVGEIPDYLKDGESAFLAEPDSAEAFAEKLDFVLSHPEVAKRVGLKGREVALKYFNYKTQAKRIIYFIDKLNQR